MKPERILLSPGPCTPHEAGILVPLIRHMAGKAPILGRLPGPPGHRRSLRRQGGARAHADARQNQRRRARRQGNLCRPAPRPLTCTRYHSLIVAEESLPAELAVTARTPESEWLRHGDHGPAASQFAHRRRAVPSRERAHRGRPPDDPQLPGHVTAMRADVTKRARIDLRWRVERARFVCAALCGSAVSCCAVAVAAQRSMRSCARSTAAAAPDSAAKRPARCTATPLRSGPKFTTPQSPLFRSSNRFPAQRSR